MYQGPLLIKAWLMEACHGKEDRKGLKAVTQWVVEPLGQPSGKEGRERISIRKGRAGEQLGTLLTKQGPDLCLIMACH